MTNRLTQRFTTFLDRFEERLEVDCEQLKRQLLARVDHQFGVVRSKVTELRSRFDGGRADRDVFLSFHLDDLKVETVSLDEWNEQRHTAAECQVTPSGHKRNLQSQPGTVKKRKTTADSPNKKHVCKYEGCDRAFVLDAELARHERIHLGIKPYSCSWPDCRFSSEKRSHVVRHVRTRHFKLPSTHKQQYLLNIEDNRDAIEYVLVDNDLLQRRLD